jgi:hypothetical protein
MQEYVYVGLGWIIFALSSLSVIGFSEKNILSMLVLIVDLVQGVDFEFLGSL